MENNKNNAGLVQDVKKAQSSKVVFFKSSILVDNENFQLTGRKTKIFNPTIPSVVLNSENVESAFQEAIRLSIDFGQKFHTRLSPECAVPIFEWEVAPLSQ